MIGPQTPVYLNAKPGPVPGGTPADLVPELRDLCQEYPFLVHRGPETVRRALRMLRGLEADAFAVEAAIEALRVEGQVLG